MSSPGIVRNDEKRFGLSNKHLIGLFRGCLSRVCRQLCSLQGGARRSEKEPSPWFFFFFFWLLLLLVLCCRERCARKKTLHGVVVVFTPN